MLSAVISVSHDIYPSRVGYSLTALWSQLDHFLVWPVAAYHFLPLIRSREVLPGKTEKSAVELSYALAGKTLPMAAKCPLKSQRENISHAA